MTGNRPLSDLRGAPATIAQQPSCPPRHTRRRQATSRALTRAQVHAAVVNMAHRREHPHGKARVVVLHCSQAQGELSECAVSLRGVIGGWLRWDTGSVWMSGTARGTPSVFDQRSWQATRRSTRCRKRRRPSGHGRSGPHACSPDGGRHSSGAHVMPGHLLLSGAVARIPAARCSRPYPPCTVPRRYSGRYGRGGDEEVRLQDPPATMRRTH